VNWTTLDTEANQADTVSEDTLAYPVANPGYYTYYRLNVTASNATNAIQLDELKLLASSLLPPAPLAAGPGVVDLATGGTATASSQNAANGEGAAQAFRLPPPAPSGWPSPTRPAAITSSAAGPSSSTA